MKSIFSAKSAVLALSLITAASAYKVDGTVKNASGAAIANASVSLLQKGKSATTDASGYFAIEEETAIRSQVVSAGSWNVQNEMLTVSAGAAKLIQIEIFDMNGSKVLSHSGMNGFRLNLQKLPKQGIFVAQVKSGNANEIFRFSPGVNANGTLGESASRRLLLKEGEVGDTLRVVAENYDTLKVAIGTLDTTVALTLTETNVEETFAFGWAKGNAPVPTRGCGHELTIPKTGSFDFKWSGSDKARTIRVDIPDNYDNKKPYRLVFGMHCMGGWAGGVQQEGYYGMKPLDTEKSTIFIAPEGNGEWAPWGQGDYTMFDELLDKLESELCIDSSRVFSAGFSYGSMFTNGLSRNHKDKLRAVAAYETAEINIWLPGVDSQKSIAWMGVVAMSDNTCTPDMGRAARNTVLKYNGPNVTDASGEQAQEYTGGLHVCYDYKTVDPRFPVKWCTTAGGHIWDHKDPGQNTSWVPQTTWDFFTQF